MSILRENNWISNQTRAVLIELNILNQNIYTLAYVSILFEFLPTGNIVKSFSIDPIDIYLNRENLRLYEIVSQCIFMALTSIIMIQQIKAFFETHLENYFSKIRNYIDLILIIMSFFEFVYFSKEFFESERIRNEITPSLDLDLRPLISFHQKRTIFFGTCVFLLITKSIQFFDINQTIIYFRQAIVNGKKDFHFIFIDGSFILVLW